MIARRIAAVIEALLSARVEISIVDYLTGEVVHGRAREDALERLVAKTLRERDAALSFAATRDHDHVKLWDDVADALDMGLHDCAVAAAKRMRERAEKAEAELAIARPKAARVDEQEAWERELDTIDGETPRPLRPTSRLSRAVRPDVELVDDGPITTEPCEFCGGIVEDTSASVFLCSTCMADPKVNDAALFELRARRTAEVIALRDGSALFEELLAAAETKPTDPPVLPADVLDAEPDDACCEFCGEPSRSAECGHKANPIVLLDDGAGTPSPFHAGCHEEALKMDAARKALGIEPVTVEDARERFLEAITPGPPPYIPTAEEVRIAGEAFEAGAVWMPAPKRQPRASIDPNDPGDERHYTLVEVTGWPVGDEPKGEP